MEFFSIFDSSIAREPAAVSADIMIMVQAMMIAFGVTALVVLAMQLGDLRRDGRLPDVGTGSADDITGDLQHAA